MTRKDTSWYDEYGPKHYDKIFKKYNIKVREFKKDMVNRTFGLVLDVGCGNGLLAHLIEDGVYVDFSPVALSGFNGRRIVASVEDLPFRDAIFDGVIAIEVIEHTNNPRRFVVDAMRVSKDLLLLSFPSRSRGKNHKWRRINQSHLDEWFDGFSYVRKVLPKINRWVITCRH